MSTTEEQVSARSAPELAGEQRAGLIETPFSSVECDHTVRELEFRTLIENLPDVISRVDRDGRYTYVNPSAESVFQVSRDYFVGRTTNEIGLPFEAADAIGSTIAEAFQSGDEKSAPFSIPAPDGIGYFMARAIPEEDLSGQVESVLSIVTDITEPARARINRDQLLEKELEARKQAEAASQARDQFLAIVSHELRSPLNGIQNWSYVLENHLPDPPSVVKRALSGIRSGIEQQVRLIDDLLDATRIMSGKLSLALQPIALLPIVNAAIDSVRAAADAKRIVIEATFELENDTVVGDTDRLQQIFWNLLSNAVKFGTPGGHIWLTSTAEPNTVTIHISDNGRGIAPEFLPHMFEWFRRDQTDRKRAQEGLGLGLALVRNLCDLHGGRVAVRSDGIGEGATFSVQLPLKARSLQALAQPQWHLWQTPTQEALAGLRVLLIDDQRNSLESLAALLQHAGAQTTTMLSGKEAREWLEACNANDAPHALLCDIAMPGEDGYTTLRKLRAGESARGIPTAARLPAIAISASAQREDRIRALASGFQMFITKPSSLEELIVALATVTGRQLPQPSFDGASS